MIQDALSFRTLAAVFGTAASAVGAARAAIESEQLDCFRLVIGIKAVVAAQAVDLGAPRVLGAAGRMLREAIRARVEPLKEDRATGRDIERTVDGLETPNVAGALASFWQGK